MCCLVHGVERIFGSPISGTELAGLQERGRTQLRGNPALFSLPFLEPGVL